MSRQIRPPRIPLDEVAEIVRNWPTPTGYGPYIAGRWGVPLPTARRWIYQARQVGLLAPGTADRPCPACDGSGVSRWGSRDWPAPDSPHATPTDLSFPTDDSSEGQELT